MEGHLLELLDDDGVCLGKEHDREGGGKAIISHESQHVGSEREKSGVVWLRCAAV